VKRRSKARVQPKRTAEHQAARKQLQTLKDGIANAATQLRDMRDELCEINSFVFVCLVALREHGGDDVGPDVATVLGIAYDKLALDVNRNIRDALVALGQDGDK
jgi:hypothetical protein